MFYSVFNWLFTCIQIYSLTCTNNVNPTTKLKKLRQSPFLSEKNMIENLYGIWHSANRDLNKRHLRKIVLKLLCTSYVHRVSILCSSYGHSMFAIMPSLRKEKRDDNNIPSSTEDIYKKNWQIDNTTITYKHPTYLVKNLPQWPKQNKEWSRTTKAHSPYDGNSATQNQCFYHTRVTAFAVCTDNSPVVQANMRVGHRCRADLKCCILHVKNEINFQPTTQSTGMWVKVPLTLTISISLTN